MFLLNRTADYGFSLLPVDAQTLGAEAAREVELHLRHRRQTSETPLLSLPALAREAGVAAIHVKDEGQRLGLGSFKALGGAYAVIRLVLDEAAARLGRPVGMADLQSAEVRVVSQGMVFACATDGNHGRSVAQGARLVGGRAAIFVHSGVSDERVEAIARFGADMIRVEGSYDDSVREAARVAAERGWTVVSDTSWPGYERIPGLVMQGYTALVAEALRQMGEPPTHVFIQAGVGGIAAAMAGHLAVTMGDRRPKLTVVDPARAACLFESAKAGRPVILPHGAPTVMAMLECYEPSLVAWRILARAADAFMTVDEHDAISVMRRLASPAGGDPAIVAGESGGVGLAGFLKAAASDETRGALAIGPDSRILVVNTEGATDPGKYCEIVGLSPEDVLSREAA